MRPIRPERGVTLIELVIAMVLVGIITAAIAFFLPSAPTVMSVCQKQQIVY